MDTLTITLTNPRHIDGYTQAANGAGMTPEALALEFLEAQGARYANDFRIGWMTSATFITRFTPSEYASILEAANTDPQVDALVKELLQSPVVVVDDPRLAPGLQYLVFAGLLEESRVPELLAYDRPTP